MGDCNSCGSADSCGTKDDKKEEQIQNNSGAHGHACGTGQGINPADFLIGPDLVIKKAYYGKDIADHLPIEEIVGFVK